MQNALNNKWKLVMYVVVTVSVPIVLFFGFQENTPNIAELAYVTSGPDYVGAVVPASCESNPPKNHAGDCPVGVNVQMDNQYARIGIDSTSVSLLSDTHLAVIPNGTNSWIIGTSGQGGSNVTIRINYSSSGGATECWNQGKNPVSGSSGSFQIVLPAAATHTYAINCTDGVHWSGATFVTLRSDFYEPEP